MQKNLIFHQLFEKETSTYTYLLADAVSKEAIIIDSVIEMVDRDTKLIEELGLKLKYILDTHVHADHITASGEIRARTGAKVAISSAYDLSCSDLHLEDGQVLKFGDFSVDVIHTPGHTSGCITYKVDNMLFTGDALLVRGCGRTDFQGGSSENLYTSVTGKLFSLPDETIVFPGHDYKGFTKTTIGLEKKLNPRLKLGINKNEFMEIMANLKLAYPKKINEAVPANMQCGLTPQSVVLNKEIVGGVPLVSPEALYGRLGHIKVIDVRGEDEFNNELGHIPGAKLVTLGPVLDEQLNQDDRKQEIVFVCRSGKRSAEATKIALNKGYEKVYNMEGGMLKWTELRFPFERDSGGS